VASSFQKNLHPFSKKALVKFGTEIFLLDFMARFSVFGTFLVIKIIINLVGEFFFGIKVIFGELCINIKYTLSQTTTCIRASKHPSASSISADVLVALIAR